MASLAQTIKQWFDYAVGRAHDPGDNANGGELGIDLSTPRGTNIWSPWGGVVTYAGSNPSTGGMVKILTNIPGYGQVYEYFLHLDTINVQKGQQIGAGASVGLSGGEQPGAGRWPHVEFGLFRDPKYANQYWGFTTGSTLDPTPLVKALHASGGGPLPGGVDPNNIPGVTGLADLFTSATDIPKAILLLPTAMIRAIESAIAAPFLAFEKGARTVALDVGILTLALVLIAIGALLIFWDPISGAAKDTAGAARDAAMVAA